ncbi:sugar nucleotide-binding protein [Bdellovibrionota bacterium FG-2]
MARTKAILIVGGSGFVGSHLALHLREGYKVFATTYTHRILIPGVTVFPLAVDNRDWMKRMIYTTQPDVVIYAVGSHTIGREEADKRKAESAHAGGAVTLCDVADIMQPKFIYLSHCQVFDGEKGNFHETDSTLPTTDLGRVKIQGENFIKGRSLNHIIVRSSPLFGRSNGRTFSPLDRLRISLDRGQRVELPTNEYYSYAPIYGLVDMISRLIETNIRNKIFHYGGLTKVSQYEFAREFAKRFGFDQKLVSPLRQESTIASKAKPIILDYSLNCTQAVQTLKIKPLLLEQGFDLIEKHLITHL